MRIDALAIENFLKRVDASFPTPLSAKQNLHDFAVKLYNKATVCAETDGEQILSAVIGYTENIIDDKAYISVVATVPEFCGRGFAPKLVEEFIEICASKNIDAVHLYAVPTNTAAIRMYRKLGFVEYRMHNEPRPDDAHLIYYIKK